jgi:Holliday junction resolvasome RuvABC endonuclease subunit
MKTEKLRVWSAAGGKEPVMVVASPIPPRTPDGQQISLALDLGTLTGWALLAGQVMIESGTERLASEHELRQQRRGGRERTLDVRFSRLLHFINRKLAAGATRIIYEDLLFASTTAQTQLWASLRAAIWIKAETSGIIVHCLPASSLKKYATGSGRAQKGDMAHALTKAEPERYQPDQTSGSLVENGRPLDDNEVDAIWLARYLAAFDRGEQEFITVHQRRALDRAAKRAKRAAAKARKKERMEAKDASSCTRHPVSI